MGAVLAGLEWMQWLRRVWGGFQWGGLSDRGFLSGRGSKSGLGWAGLGLEVALGQSSQLAIQCAAVAWNRLTGRVPGGSGEQRGRGCRGCLARWADVSRLASLQWLGAWCCVALASQCVRCVRCVRGWLRFGGFGFGFWAWFREAPEYRERREVTEPEMSRLQKAERLACVPAGREQNNQKIERRRRDRRESFACVFVSRRDVSVGPD